MVYLPVKFRRGSVHFPQRYSPHNPDVRLVSHYGVHIFSGSFLHYCCRSPLCPALRTTSPEFLCTAWHISSQPAPSVPLVLGQRILLVSPVSRTYFGHLRSIVKIEKSSLVVSVSPEPSAYGPFLPDTCHVHLPLSFVSLPWMCRICQDWFFTDLISTRGLGVRGWPSGKTEMLRSVVALPE